MIIKQHLWNDIKKYSIFDFFKRKKNSVIGLLDFNNEVSFLNNISSLGEKSIKILDTFSLLKSNFVELLRKEFIDGILYIPAFILKEAHHMSNSENILKQEKGKIIMNNISQLSEETKNLFINSQIDNIVRENTGYEIVDFSLNLLKKTNIKPKVITCDNKLSSICEMKKIPVLNINKFIYIINKDVKKEDVIEIFLNEKGEKKNQAIGSTNEGVRAVVENGSDFINNKIFATVKNVWITENTRILFCDFLKSK